MEFKPLKDFGNSPFGRSDARQTGTICDAGIIPDLGFGASLTRLVFYNGHSNCAKLMVHMLKHAPNLLEFTLQQPRYKTDSCVVVQTIMKYCPLLHTIDFNLQIVTDTELRLLTEGCEHITALKMKNCEGITDDGIQLFVQKFGELCCILCLLSVGIIHYEIDCSSFKL